MINKLILGNNTKKVHFIGIGGVSMSALAEILIRNNYIVSGSDNNSNAFTNNLQKMGATIYKGQHQDNIKDDIDLVIYTAAVKEDNPEYIASKAKNIKLIDRAELLGTIMKIYKYPIAVSGTHGKTTTTSIIGKILIDAKKDPTISVGGFLKVINGNFRMGNSEYIVAESCEYFDSFLKFYPHIGLILNVEYDHSDYFKNLEHIQESFNKFAKNIDKNGYLIINNNIKNFENITKNLECNIITFGSENADYYYKNVQFSPLGTPSFDIYHKNNFISNVNLNVVGIHNILNAMAAFIVSSILDIPTETAINSLETFENPNRRFQFKGELNGVKIIDDYAHHPTEIKSTLASAKRVDHNKIYCVFQPHTFTRTLEFLDDFSKSFEDADTIIILDIFPAREIDTGKIHSKDLVNKIKNLGKDVFYFSTFEDAKKYMLSNLVPNDLLITMGAGDVYLLGESLLS